MGIKFSIITCAYNSAEHLLNNIQSVQWQSYQNWEHIFVDGFSTDKTVDIIKSYSEQFPGKIKFYQCEPKGISNAMNEGVKKSSGEYLIHLHSDDSFYDNNVLADVANFLNSNSYDWIYGKINVIEADGQNVGIFPKRKIWQGGSSSWLSKYLLKFYNFIPHQAVFIKRGVFERFGYFDESLKSSMDTDLWLRLKDKTRWSFYDRIISNYCLRAGSQSASVQNLSLNKANFLAVQKRHLNFWERKLAGLLNIYLNNKNRNLR